MLELNKLRHGEYKMNETRMQAIIDRRTYMIENERDTHDGDH